ncbi:Crp/Fnr family transcriptional regulator [Olivibacter ginsenosidimutans]|uniref:Crp/Fnr family transcriptional regulator n=1 Tax=Olivibacter ginsenosidimutans TaxID=1176537 RepID=A0ABP9AH97_9SPHI
MNYELILKNVAKHIQLDDMEADFFISLLEHKTIKRKSFLLRQGEPCKTENFIIKGCTRTYTVDENGFEHIVMFGVEDWWVGDLSSLLTKTPAHYFIDALEETEVLQITKPNLDLLYERVPKFERFFRIIIQNAFISQQIRINQNLSYTAEQRYNDFVERYPTLEQRISQKQIASYLGITPVFLSMLRRRIARK